MKNYGGTANMAKPVTRPFSTVTTPDHRALVIPYHKGNRPAATDQPLLTMGTREPVALLRPHLSIEDCHWRMLTPRAQRFPDTYQVEGTKTEQTAQAGNASPPTSRTGSAARSRQSSSKHSHHRGG